MIVSMSALTYFSLLVCTIVLSSSNGSVIKNNKEAVELRLENNPETEDIRAVRSLENACAENPCMNGGTCVLDGHDASCICLESYSGEICEEDPCTNYPCNSNETCKVVDGKANCTSSTTLPGVQVCVGNCVQNCFHGTSIVLTHTGEKLMEDVQLGDEVASGFNQDGSIIFSPVIAFLHRDENVKSSFIQLKTESGSTLLVTDKHLLFRSTDQINFDAVHADQIQVGDLVHTNKVGELSSKSIVTAIASQTMTGVFAPLTIDGTIFVNNILASCYAEVDSHTKAHMAFLPLRFYYYIMNAFKSLERLWSIPLNIAEGDQSFRMGNIDSSKAEVLQKLNSQGIHWYPKMLCWLTNSNCK